MNIGHMTTNQLPRHNYAPGDLILSLSDELDALRHAMTSGELSDIDFAMDIIRNVFKGVDVRLSAQAAMNQPPQAGATHAGMVSAIKNWAQTQQAAINGQLAQQRQWAGVNRMPQQRLSDVQVPGAITTGHHCKKCHNFNEYASSNQPDGSYVCFGCRP